MKKSLSQDPKGNTLTAFFEPDDFPTIQLLKPIAEKYSIPIPSSYEGTSEDPHLLALFEYVFRQGEWWHLNKTSLTLHKSTQLQGIEVLADRFDLYDRGTNSSFTKNAYGDYHATENIAMILEETNLSATSVTYWLILKAVETSRNIRTFTIPEDMYIPDTLVRWNDAASFLHVNKKDILPTIKDLYPVVLLRHVEGALSNNMAGNLDLKHDYVRWELINKFDLTNSPEDFVRKLLSFKADRAGKMLTGEEITELYKSLLTLEVEEFYTLPAKWISNMFA